MFKMLSIVLNLLGIGPMLDEQGLNMGRLIAFAAVFGFGGSLISLVISKWTAKRMTGAAAWRMMTATYLTTVPTGSVP